MITITLWFSRSYDIHVKTYVHAALTQQQRKSPLIQLGTGADCQDCYSCGVLQLPNHAVFLMVYIVTEVH